MSGKQEVTRRNVLQASAVVAAASALGTNFAHAAGSDTIKIGVIGCGGRGSGAVGNALEAAKIVGANAEVVAAADAFADRVNPIRDRYKIPADKAFAGLDGYKGVVASDANYVIMATPPGFRPIHFKASIEAGKNTFFEKPVAVDPVGIRMVMAAGKLAAEKKLGVATGTQRRHETNYTDTIKAIHDGAIGDVLHMSVYWNGGGIWYNRRNAGQSDVEYQMRNWYHYVWLCGDQIVEQHVHNLDVANWVLNSHPISAYGMGGRQVRDRLGQKPGQIWDHFAIEYEYANGARVLSFCRHWPDADDNVSEFAIGTKGTSNPGGWYSVKGGERKSFRNARSGYVQEHVDLMKSIQDGKPINEAQQVAESTFTAIIGRMSAYTGKRVNWDWALNQSKLSLMPDPLDIKGTLPEPEVPQPGIEKLI